MHNGERMNMIKTQKRTHPRCGIQRRVWSRIRGGVWIWVRRRVIDAIVLVPPPRAITSRHWLEVIAIETDQVSFAVRVRITVALAKPQGFGTQIASHEEEVVGRASRAVVVLLGPSSRTSGDGFELVALVAEEAALEERWRYTVEREKCG